ncbi:MAG TPA: carboxypeptidase-like regulatory domain-containing protein [Flavobacteriales bacterium]|nr:carboxypeptidase regulatory-like domain-containing protein [Flavobacteriales bacterium]HQW85731.1 carboxypeptidase-like regulatory domain-containing protein [Flavobacteriales bacterium]
MTRAATPFSHVRSALVALLLLSAPLCGGSACAQSGPDDVLLPITGRITDGEHKLEGCEVITYRDNERVGSITTDKSGRFGLGLALNSSFSIEFRRAGFVPKRVQIDTHFPKAPDDLVFEPLVMDIGMLAEAKYNGVSTDELDFPFARIRYDERAGMFAQDPEWTMGMQRTNGALLLMAGRVEKRER